MEELPVITEHGYNIYRRCISSFLYARKLLVGRITKALLDLNEVCNAKRHCRSKRSSCSFAITTVDPRYSQSSRRY